MTPTRITCTSSWTQRYNGYLMSECYTYTIAQCTYASIKSLNQYLEVLQMQVGGYCTMWKQLVQGLLVLHTQLGENWLVQYALSNLKY